MPLDVPHASHIDEVVAGLGVDPAVGLSSDEVGARQTKYGPNRLEPPQGSDLLRRLLHQFSDVLIWLLLVAAAVSGILLGEWIEAGVILAIVVVNASLGYRQESKADEALAALEALAAPKSAVLRDGTERDIAGEELVPGDIVILEAGDMIPADLRVIDGVDLRVDESALTGESMPVKKGVDAVATSSGVGDRTSMLHVGSVVVAGRGRGVVTATGTHTVMGGIAGLLSEADPPTPLEVELKRVGWRLTILAVVVGAALFILGASQGRALESMFLLAVALAVAAIPEGLPAIVTLTLAKGVRRMAEHNAIVRRLPAVEALGAATVICTDKTGTLTRNEIRVQEADLADMHVLDLETEAEDRRVQSYLRIGVLCNDAHRTDDGWSGDPTEVALIRSAEGMIDVDEMRSRWRRIAEVGFDSARKRMATLHESDGEVLLAVKGAPEEVVPRCDRFEDASGVHPLGTERAAAAVQAAEEMAARGLRTLALAQRSLDRRPDDVAEVETELVLVAIVGMRDELRPEALDSVAEAEAAGITVVMITGDHEATAATIGRELGLSEGRQVVGGAALAALSVDELVDSVQTNAVYARVDPADKVKIVRAWQARGEVVAMTGDGVNDAPALRIADIGVAMGSGTDVARQASDIVLADDNFATIVRAIREGRTIYANLRKVVAFLLGGNLSEVMVVLVGFLVWGGLGEPLLATQLLWVNLVTDGLPALALGVDPADPDVMRRSPHQGSVLSWRRQARLLLTGMILALPVLAVFAYGVAAELPWEYVRTMGFCGLVLTQLGYVYALKIGDAGWKAGLVGNRSLAWAVFGSILLQVLVVLTPVGNLFFSTVPIALSDWVVAGMAALGGSLAVVGLTPLLARIE